MFEALVERLLNKILGEYIENFSAENLSIGIWSGEVVLKNVVLKKDVIKRLNLPFRIRYSRLGCLKMNIPWKSLTSSKIEVLLEGFELILEEIPQTEWVYKNSKIIQERTKEIQNYCETILNDFAKKAEKGKEGEEGYVSKLIVKILDNLQITIRDIHVRYQNDNTKYSFGVTLEELKLYTVNADDKPEYVDRNKP
jgi:vacuolar protein sorting-associated protein 13A/C